MFKLRITGDLGFEFWQDIPGYEGYYQVSTYGKVKALERTIKQNGYSRVMKGRMLSPIKNPKRYNVNYYSFKLTKNGVGKMWYGHILVARAFLPNFNNCPQINHIDENGLNNRVENLEYCTAKQNVNHGTHNQRVKEHNSKVHILQYDINGNFVKEWLSQKEIERELGYLQSTISRALQRNGIYKNYIWQKKRES